MTQVLTCSRCDVPLELGFIPDLAYGPNQQATWCAGEPEVGWTGVVKSRQLKGRLPLKALRCPSCGLIELYAPTPDQPAH